MAIRTYASSTITHPTWVTKTEYGALDFIIPTTPNNYSYECTNPGISGSVEPSWPTTPGQTVVDGDFEQENPAIWTCRNLLSPNPLVAEMDTEGFGGYSLKDIWVNSSREVGLDLFIVYGSHDGENWRQLDIISIPTNLQAGSLAVHNGQFVTILAVTGMVKDNNKIYTVIYYDGNGNLHTDEELGNFNMVSINKHQTYRNAYRSMKVVVDSEYECEIEIVAGAN